MNLLDLKIKFYDLPLVKPLTINGTTTDRRRGVILFLTDSAGLTGCGETAPLPGLHTETLDQAISQLKPLGQNIRGRDINPAAPGFEERLTASFPEDLAPSVRMGIDMALFNLFRQADRDFISERIKPVGVNGLIMPGDSLSSEVLGLIKRGYTTIKIKVGRQSVEEDIRMVQSLIQMAAGKTIFRLDANRAWQLDEAMMFCNSIDRTQIEYIEEPLKNITDLPALCGETDFPVALDETIARQGEDGIINLPDARAVVIKPGLVGGLAAIARIIRLARENNKKVCLSSAFETSVSLETFAALAAFYNLTDTAHGLDTTRWLAEDLLIDPLTVTDGAIEISSSPPAVDRLRMDILKDIND